MMIPNEPPWVVEIDGTQFAASESVLMLLKAVSEERDELEAENERLKWEYGLLRVAFRVAGQSVDGFDATIALLAAKE